VRYLILSDIHANIDALEAVLAAAPPATWDRALVLGDLVGYGAEPNAVIERTLALNPLSVIRGNHDKAASGVEDGSTFN
jgi:predicted phosphodiesterase